MIKSDKAKKNIWFLFGQKKAHKFVDFKFEIKIGVAH